MKKIVAFGVLLFIYISFVSASTNNRLNSLLYGKRWLPVEFIEILKSDSRNAVIMYQPDIKKNNNWSFEFDREQYWYEQGIFSFMALSYNYNTNSIWINFHSGRLFDYIDSKDLEDDSIIVKLKQSDSSKYNLKEDDTKFYDIIDVSGLDHEAEFCLVLQFDGDYLSVKAKDGSFLHKYFKCDDKTFSELESLIYHNTCDLSKVTWPRHADGTCDSEIIGKKFSQNEIAAGEKSVSLSAGITKIVMTNLRLRSTEDTSSTVITTMQKGTAVKIIKTGSQDTIDGITSNWVQVEVEAGAKDRNGKSITAGTTGWCFGGYLE